MLIKGIKNRNALVAKNHLQPPKSMSTINKYENYDSKAPNPLYRLIFQMSVACHSYAICMPIVCTRMSHVCHSYVTRIY